MQKRLYCALGLAIVGAVLLGTQRTQGAQDSVLLPGGGGFAPMGPSVQSCAWTLNKPDAFWGYITIVATGDRLYSRITGENYEPSLSVTANLRTTYLPTQTIHCTAADYGVEYGIINAPSGTSYDIEHTNTDCDGYATLVWGNRPTTPYYVTQELYDANQTAAYGATDGGSYWTGVGSAIFYSDLQTPEDGVVFAYPHTFSDPNIVGQWDPGTDQLWFNTSRIFAFAEWAWVTAHELGHAIGFGHSQSGDYAKTIMMPTGFPQTDLTPRTLENAQRWRLFL